MASRAPAKRFAASLALFYAASFGLLGTHLPFFTVWLKAIGIDPGWIGIVSAVPSVTRFTVLPLVTGSAERHHALRLAMMLAAFATVIGLSIVGLQNAAVPLLLVYVVTCCCWTPLVPLTDAYALRGVARYGLDYGPLRLWGSAAFVLGALACGLLVDLIAARHLIWIIVAVAALVAASSLLLRPLDDGQTKARSTGSGSALLRDPAFLGLIISAALIQSSHVAYYVFASINWQAHGLGGLTIAGLWTLGVLAEIVVFALSPRFTLAPYLLVVIGGLSALVRWSITAAEPPLFVLALVQLAHGLTFGLTQLGTMGQMVRQVPVQVMARAQGYYTACSGLLTCVVSIGSGALYARYGEGLYYLMAAMGGGGAVLMWLTSIRFHPHSAASGG